MSDDEPGDPASKSAAGSVIDGPTMRFPGAGLVEFAAAGGMARTQVTIPVIESHKIARGVAGLSGTFPVAAEQEQWPVARLFERLKKWTLDQIESFTTLGWRTHFSNGVPSGCGSVAGSWARMQTERLSV